METRARDVSADQDRVHQRLRDMAQAVLNDEDYLFEMADTGLSSPRRLSPLRSIDRFESPDRALGRYVCFNLNIIFLLLRKHEKTNMNL